MAKKHVFATITFLLGGASFGTAGIYLSAGDLNMITGLLVLGIGFFVTSGWILCCAGKEEKDSPKEEEEST